MFKNKAAPYCTCNCCEGTKTHPGDSADGSFEREGLDASIQNRKHELPPALPELPKKAKQEMCSALSVAAVEPSNAIHLHQRTGGSCLVCDIKKSPSAVHIPFIYLGRFSEFMVCKKQHLLEEADYLKLGKLLNIAWDQIEKNKSDEPNTAFRDSDDEAPAPTQHTCVGYQVMDGSTVCGRKCTVPLFFDLDAPHWFCKPSHMLRYLAYHYGKQGKNCHSNRHRVENEVKKAGKKTAKGKGKKADAGD
jgi:hypothetical protein